MALLALALAAAPLRAQQPAAETSGAPALSLEAVATLRAREKSGPPLSPELSARFAEICNQAEAAIRSAADWTAKADEFARLRAEAPKRLAEIRIELRKPLSEPEDPPADASLESLELALQQAAAGLAQQQQIIAQTDDERARRGARLIELSQLISAAAGAEEPSAPGEDERPAPLISEARALLAEARAREAAERGRAYREEAASYEARGELLVARREDAARKAALGERQVALLQERVDRARVAEALLASQRAIQAQADAPPAIRQLAQENVALAQRRLGPSGTPHLIADASKELGGLKRELERVRTSYAAMVEKVRVGGFSGPVGLFLRRQRADLPPVAVHRKRIADRQETISRAQLDQIDLEQRLKDLADPQTRAADALAGIQNPGDSARKAAREVADIERGLLTALAGDYDRYFAPLVELDTTERALVAETRRYFDFIREHILWIRSAEPLSLSDLAKAFSQFGQWLRPEPWRNAAGLFFEDLRERPISSAVVILLFGFLLAIRPRASAELRETGLRAENATNTSIVPTLEALFYTLVLAAAWPVLIGGIGRKIAVAPAAAESDIAIGSAIMALGLVVAAIGGLREFCRPHGLAQSHFGWDAGALKRMRRELLWFGPAYAFTEFLFALEHIDEGRGEHSALLRLAIVAGMLTRVAFAWRIFSPARGVIGQRVTREASSTLWRLRYVWFALILALPGANAVLAALGYTYTALDMTSRIQSTVWFGIALVIIQQLVSRALHLSHRRMAQREARRHWAEAYKAGQASDSAVEGAMPKRAEEPSLSRYDRERQTRALTTGALLMAFLAGAWFFWADAFPALKVLQRVEIWRVQAQVTREVQGADGAARAETRLEERPITLGNLGLAVVIFALTILASKNLPGALETAVLSRFSLEAGLGYAITTVARYVIGIVGVVAAFNSIGIGWSKVQWLVAAVSVGLGFGLQEIFANFVSGLIILFERPIRVGDTVTIGGVNGTVHKIRMRATTILDWDRKELIVPNKEFITTQLINWTLSDRVVRLVIPVGVAYGTDPQVVRDLLLQIAKSCPFVLAQPEPTAIFNGFGESSLDFQLRVFLPDLDRMFHAKHDLNVAIEAALRERGIDIPFPHREVHIKSADPGAFSALRQEAGLASQAVPMPGASAPE